MTTEQNEQTLDQPVILIGPMQAGKTTVGQLLAEKLKLPFESLDRHERTYTYAAGFDEEKAAKIREAEGGFAWYSYRRTFFDEAVVRFLAEFKTGVLELGAGHPIMSDTAKQARVNDALAPFKYVFLLMPLPDIAESLAILKERQPPGPPRPDLNALFLEDRRFFDMAKTVVYTDGKTPEVICQEIIAML